MSEETATQAPASDSKANVLGDLAGEVIDDRRPPGKNAQALINQEMGGQTAFEGIPAPPAPEPGFDPALHEADAAGNPIRNTDGTLRKKRGRKSRDPSGKFAPAAAVNSSPAPFAPVQLDPMQEDLSPAISRDAARISAEQTINLALGGCMAIFGDEWKPEKTADRDEQKELVAALTEFYFEKQFAGASPTMILVMACGAYAFPRVQKPKTKIVLGTWWLKIRQWFTRLRMGR